MSPRTRRILAVGAWVLGALVVVLAMFLTWLLGTGAGLRFAVATGLRQTPMSVAIERIEGRIWGDMRFQGIDLSLDDTHARLESFALEWSPWELFARRVHVQRLELSGLTVTLAPPREPQPKPSEPAAELPELELPFRVQMDTVRFRGITLRQAGRADSFRVDQIALDGLQYKDSLGVQRFALATPWGELRFRGWMRTKGDYPLDLAIQWNLQPPDRPPVVGYGSVSGDLYTLVIQQDVTAPAKLHAQVRLQELTRGLHFDANARLEPTPLSVLQPGAPDVTVGGELDASGNLDRQLVSLGGNLASPEYGDWDVSARIEASVPRVELSQLLLTQRGTEARISGTGHVDLDTPGASLTFLADWAQLAWPPVGETLVTLPRGTLEFAGEPADWRVEAESEVHTARGVNESLRAQGHGDTTSFVFEQLTGTLLGGSVDAEGRVTWSPHLTWDVTANARSINTGVLAPDWPSDIGGRIYTAGTWQDTSAWAARFDLEDLGGELRGRPLRGHLRFAGSSDSTSVMDAQFGYASATCTLSGPVLSPIDARWELDVPSLEDLDSSLAGRIEGSGRFEGPDRLAKATARLQAAGLAAAGSTAGSATIEASFDRTQGDAADLVVLARCITVPPLAPFDSVRIGVRGTRERYDFLVAIESELRRLRVSGSASQADSVVAGRIEQFESAVAENAPWSLVEPAPFEVTPSRGRLGPFSARATSASLRVAADWVVDGDANVEATLNGLPLSNLNAFLPAEYRVEGTVSSSTQLTLHQDGVLDGEMRVEPMGGKVAWQASRAIEVPFEDLRLHISSNAEALRLESGIRLPDLGALSLSADLPQFRWNRFDSTQAIHGAVEAEASKWDLVETLLPDVRRMQGQLRADVTIGGTVAAPSLAGEVRFADGAVDLPEYGLELRDVQVQAKGSGQGDWSLESSLRSGPGTLTMKADANLSDLRQPRASVDVEGENFKVVDTFEALVLVSPDLELQLNGTRLDVTGEVTVPSAKIDAAGRTVELAVPLSQDVRVIREVPDTTALPIELHTRVRLTLGGDVSFKGYGVEAEPEGSIVVTQQPNRPALAQGELSLRSGTYTGYGRNLEIGRGRFYYAGGPVDDPEVDIRASREIEKNDVIVGFEVTGTLKQPQLAVFSDPEMSQADAISYLLFGRPIAEAQSSESAIARETATAMGLQAGSAYTQKLASKFGLDEASLESEGTLQDASLMLGTYLSPSLYARYGIGIFDSANTFKLSYILSKHWTVEAETSEQNRAGITYTIEP